MFGKREIFTAAGALACAIGVGYFMQTSDTAKQMYGEVDQPSVGQPLATNASVLDVEGITLTSGKLEEAPALLLPAEDERIITASAPASVLSDLGLPHTAEPLPACDITATARPVAAAQVNLILEAACMPNERVTVHHSGMVFTQATDAEGKLNLTVPALTEDAVYILAFSNGDGAVAQTRVEDLGDFSRVVLQWRGAAGVQIHAREFGADYDSAGHVWRGAPHEASDAITGTGGFISEMGDSEVSEPLLAEVYSFPTKFANRDGMVALSVETEVSEANCGQEIEAQTLELVAPGSLKTRDVTMAVPECDAKGEFLVLNNLLQDLKVAHN